MLSRRDFLGTSTATLAMGAGPAFWRQAARATEPGPDAPILVVVELSGGNDGLNTVVPHADDVYHKSRPALRIEPGKVLKLDDHMGLHPAMKELHALWGEGALAVVQGVGYPNPNRSHFRSMEIWQTAAPGPVPTAGWLGQAADANPKMQLCHVGLTTVPLAMRGRKAVAQSLASIDAYRLESGAEIPLGSTADEAELPLAEVRDRIASSVELARRLERVRGGSVADGEDQTLRGRLGTIRKLIEADTPYRVYYTALDGFDTHANQTYPQQRLLEELSQGIAGLLKDLKASKLDRRVLVVAFSEFGRRLSENASGGTDHGAPAPVLIAGPAVKPGLFGPPPDLKDLDESGDPHFVIDFRDVYSTLLKDWLHTDPTPILGERKSAVRIV